MRETLRISSWDVWGWTALSGGLLIVLFWALYFTGATDLGQDDELVRGFEAAFPVADALFCAALYAAGYCLLKRRALGPVLLVAAGAMSLYLGLVDATFYTRQDRYETLGATAAIGLAVNALCVVGGALAFVFGARLVLAHTAPPRASGGGASLRFLRGYLVTMRPYLMFVSGITGLAGLALAPQLPLASTLTLGLAFFLAYGFGQALTDCFQLDTDSLSAPYRPLVRGEIQPRAVLAVSVIGLAAIGAAFTLFNRWNAPLALAAVAGLATYTYFKRRWWAGPFYNAWIVGVVALIGYLCGLGPGRGRAELSVGLAATLALVFFGYANFVLIGYYKDVAADRATGYRTLPVVFGRGRAALVSDGFALLALLGCGVAVSAAWAGTSFTPATALGLALVAAGAAVSGLAQWQVHEVETDAEAHRALAPAVHAYVLLLAGVAALHKPGWALALAFFYLGFVLWLGQRPMRQQI